MKEKSSLQLTADADAYENMAGWLTTRRRRHMGGRHPSEEFYKCWVIDKILIKVRAKIADLRLDITEAREFENNEKHTHE